MLKKNREALAEAIQQEKDFKAGKASKAPAVKPETFKLVEKMILNAQGDFSEGRVTVKETLMSTDVVKLIPKVIEGQLRQAAEPEYLASKFFKKVQVPAGNSAVYVIPYVGEIYATEVQEGGRYNEQSPDFSTLENGTFEIRVKKIGTKVTITEEAISDGAWDLYSLNVQQMGRAMARKKEEDCFNAFTTHGHIIFDNSIRKQNPEAGTTGRDASGKFNNTMTMEDILDMFLAMMGNDNTPTDIIMHPLTWVIFARNSMIGNGLSFGAFGGQNVNPWGATQGTDGFAGLSGSMGPQKFIMTPEQTQGRLPFGINVNFSPFIKFDKAKKAFDMYLVNRDNVGVIAQKDELTTDNWTDPERDIRLLKAKERYGVGIIDNGRGICVARNIAVAPTYPVAPQVTIQTKQ